MKDMKMISRTMKTLKILFIILTLLFAVNVVSASAEGTAVMETVNVSWDLAPETPVTVLVHCPGLEKLIPFNAVIKDVEQSKTNKGKNVYSCTVLFTRAYEFTDEEISMYALHQNKANTKSSLAFCIVDFETGLCLEARNKLGVNVKSQTIKHGKDDHTQYKSSEGISCKYRKQWEIKITVEYPEDYEDLCIGLLGRFENDSEDRFWNGKIPFSKTVYYSSTNAEMSHFMRITPPASEETAP